MDLGRSRGKRSRPNRAEISSWFTTARQGDLQALSQLLEAFRPLLLVLANKRLDPHLRQKVPASDLVQISLMKATRAFPNGTFQTVQDVDAWLQEILNREIVATYRRFRLTQKRDTRRERNVDTPHSRKWIELLSVRLQSDQAAVVINKEEADRVSSAFGELPSHYRQVIIWRLSEEKSFAEIGTALEREEDAARMLYKRAIVRLRTLLGG